MNRRPLQTGFDVCVVICTCGPPAGLSRVLESLRRQRTFLRFEIVVVDNRAQRAGEALPAGVRWIVEERVGLSYARNAGIRAADSRIIAFLDDDMEAPEEWLEELVRPILEDRCDAVTGPTNPLQLETESERLFEAYGGHGHGRKKKEYDALWLNRQKLRLPLWQIGGFGNAAVRGDVFARAGVFEEALGAGTPAGSWEDLELIYRILRAGCRILHNPEAAAGHAHRQDLAGLTKQLCGYRRGEVSFCLIAAARYHDARALSHLLLWIPWWRTCLVVVELGRRLRGRRLFRFDLMSREILAYLSGPFALAAAFHRKRKLACPNQR